MAHLANLGNGGWSTVSCTATALGLTAQERLERFRLEALAELVLRLAGGLMVAASTVLWLLVPASAAAHQMASHGALAALFSAAGLFLYAYGSRGFRRQLSLDAKRRTLALTKVNIKDRGRVVRRIRLNEIESLFLRRPASRRENAALYVRTRRHNVPFLALTGAREELERIHHELCRNIHSLPSAAAPASEAPRPVRKLAFARR